MSSLLSSSTSSSSRGKHPVDQSLCFCQLEAILKYSTTAKNPRRPFLECPKYNKEGLPYCKFFKWVDSNEVTEFQLRERTNELVKKEKEVEKIRKFLEKNQLEMRKIVDQIKTEQMVLSNKHNEVMQKELEIKVQKAKIKRLS